MSTTSQLRRALAFIAWRLITGQQGQSIYDHANDTRQAFIGDVDETRIDVRDGRGLHLRGAGGSGMYTLETGAGAKPVTLKISGLDFEGFDYTASCRFTGSVDRRQLSLRQGRHSESYVYSIES